MQITELLAEQIDATRDWTLKLIAGLEGDDWGFQPAAGMAHPLALCIHLAAAQHLLIHVRCQNAGVLDQAFVDHFPIGSPIKALGDHPFPKPPEVLAVMADVHAKTLDAVRGMSDALLAEPAFAGDGGTHPHYKDKLGVVTHCSRHEAFHAGQIATLRRLLGKPFLR